jgi:tyrosine-protein kinase Etk/Wzc
VTDKDPRRAAEMANAYVDEYKKLSATIAVTEASQRRLFFEQQLVQAKESLADAEEALKRTQQKTGLIQLDGQARAVIESVAELRGKVAAKEVQLRAMRQFASEQNPDLQLAEQELAGLQSELSRMGSGAGGASGDFLMPKGSVPQAGLDYVRKLRDMKYNETIFELLAKQFEIAKIDEARQGSVVQLVDKAIMPDKKSSPQRLLIVAASTLVGFVLALFWVLFSEALRFARKDPKQREQLDALAKSFGRA